MTKPPIDVISAAIIEKDMVLWVRFGLRCQPCTVKDIKPNPSNFRQLVVELKAPNNIVFSVTYHESDSVEKINQS